LCDQASARPRQDRENGGERGAPGRHDTIIANDGRALG
jgi:hypothetical protein